MGNHVSYISSSSSSSSTGKVVLLDGEVHEFNKPLTVAELMLEHPRQVVVELAKSTLSPGKRPVPLPADKQLEIGKYYMMLPLKRGKPVSLSTEESHHILTKANTMLRSRSTKSFLPLFARICPAAYGGRSTEDDRVRLLTLGTEKERERTATEHDGNKDDPQRGRTHCFDAFEERLLEGGGLRPDYLRRQVSAREWRPNLDPIVEKKFEKKMPRWIIMIRKLKMTY